tara:strand:- start:577 stop:1152 length:576 start_codon:yes stop_codon:yes gene_type:complete
MNKLIFASSNNNKILEVSSHLNNIQLLSLADIGYSDSIVESGLTIEENAFIKANTIYSKYQIPCISDDTGLEVDALDGRPGVLSARYAGQPSNSQNNIQKLLKDMQGFENRSARFRTIICLINQDDKLFFEGVVNGCITHSIFGDQGFGYDPIFIPDGHKKTFAQISLNAKNQISHRSQAINQLVKYLNML